MTRKPKPGMAFQATVALIERAMQGAEGVTIESPGWVIDSGGERREHDVLIRRKVGLHEIVTAVECRDKSRKLGLNDLEAFARKCDRTGVDHRVMVSAKGFYASALKAAPAERIQCLSLQEVGTFDWIGTSVMVESVRNITRLDVRIFSSVTQVEKPFTVYGTEGDVELDMAIIAKVAQQTIRDANLANEIGRSVPGQMLITWTAPAYAVDVNGRHDLDRIEIDVDFEYVDTPKPVTLHSYEGENGRVEVAKGVMNTPDLDADVVLMRDHTGAFRLTVTAKEPEK